MHCISACTKLHCLVLTVICIIKVVSWQLGHFATPAPVVIDKGHCDLRCIPATCCH